MKKLVLLIALAIAADAQAGVIRMTARQAVKAAKAGKHGVQVLAKLAW